MTVVDYYLRLPDQTFEGSAADWLCFLKQPRCGVVDPANGYMSCTGDGAQPPFEIALFRYRDGRPLLALCRDELEGEKSLFLDFLRCGPMARCIKRVVQFFPRPTPATTRRIGVSNYHDKAGPCCCGIKRAGKSCTGSPGTAKSLSSSVTLHPTNKMNSCRYPALLFAFVLLLSGCGEPERPKAATTSVTVAPVGESFNQVGKVSLYPGESCTSQIMFVFHSGRSTSISLAAPFRESKILTDAVNEHRSVRVFGRWRRGKVPGCYYVEATQVEVQESLW